MSESVSTDDVMVGSQSDGFMDLDLDELLSEGFWLQKTDGSESLPQSPFSSSILFDPSLVWPTLEEPLEDDVPSKDTEEDSQTVLSLENSNCCSSSALVQSKDWLAKPSEQLSTRWWIGPASSTSAMDRLNTALNYIRDWSNDRDALIQVWVPVNKGSARVLTTSHQPFSLGLNCTKKLAGYREVSVKYQFPAEEGCLEEFRGLPGRVFVEKVPEWTPDVQLFRKDEYPRVGHAQHLNVRGTFGVPVFEQGDHNCLGVIEVVFVTQKIKYRQELETVCKALEAVNLRSSSSSSIQKAYDYSYQTALPVITEMLRAVCVKHSLPLAQAWAYCTRQEKEGSRHTNENHIHCVSTVDSVCFIGDPCIQGFHEASSEHHLLKGQGIVGRAFMTNQPCFSPDITSFTKTEYPLSHYAKMFDLHAALAIPMQNTYAGSTDFVLELFLPTDCKDPEERREMITSFYAIIQKVSRSLWAVTYRELQEPIVPVVSNVGEKILETEHIEAMMASQDGLSHGSHEEVKKNVGITSEGENQKLDKAFAGKSPQSRPSHLIIAASVHDDLITSGGCSSPSVGKIGEKRRAKAEKAVTLEILQQYFAGSLKDAAKSIGVCPTTLKRICRQHGIKRWPSRKIKKVGHSLKKIQRVIDSVQGASGALPVESFYSNFPELAFPRVQQHFPSSDWIDPSAKALQPSDRNLTSLAAVSKSTSSSCSQNSTSSQSGPTGTEQHPLNVIDDAGQEQMAANEELRNCLLKRVDSNSGLNLQPTSHTYFHELNNTVPPVAEQTLLSVGAYRLKVTYGEEKIRFRMQSDWGYGDVMREIGRRFGISDTGGFMLKYLDDDLEWVLLTCDDDLEECIDVYQSSGSQIIRLSFVPDSQ